LEKDLRGRAVPGARTAAVRPKPSVHGLATNSPNRSIRELLLVGSAD
jgi:hypothetical protein